MSEKVYSFYNFSEFQYITGNDKEQPKTAYRVNTYSFSFILVEPPGDKVTVRKNDTMKVMFVKESDLIELLAKNAKLPLEAHENMMARFAPNTRSDWKKEGAIVTYEPLKQPGVVVVEWGRDYRCCVPAIPDMHHDLYGIHGRQTVSAQKGVWILEKGFKAMLNSAVEF